MSVTTTATGPVPLLSIRGLSKSFPGQRALADVDLEVASGEIVAVVGQNGSGKSTLVKVLTGIHEADPGAHVEVRRADGQQVTGAEARAEIHVIHQDLGLIPMLSTVENLGLARSERGRSFAPIRGRPERHHAEELIHRFGADFDVTARVDLLTPAGRTIVAIARALDSWHSPQQVLLLDEPTAALHGSEAERLFTAVRNVAHSGAGVVFVSHRLDEVLGLADRVVALRGGRVVGNVSAAGLDRARLIELIAGRAVREVSQQVGSARSTTALEVEHLSGQNICDASLRLQAGEILGVCGILGSGREHLNGALFGATERTGTVRVAGRLVRPVAPHQAIASGMGYVPADRHVDGAVMSLRARENLTLPGLRSLRGRLGNVRLGVERVAVDEWVDRVELDPPAPERDLELFSGGNQQKVVLAKWLRNDPTVLLLDEPTQGVDVGAKAAIYQLVRDAAAKGCGVIVSSSDTAELAGLCDRVVLFRNGVIASELEREQLSESRLIQESLADESTEAPEPTVTGGRR